MLARSLGSVVLLHRSKRCSAYNKLCNRIVVFSRFLGLDLAISHAHRAAGIYVANFVRNPCGVRSTTDGDNEQPAVKMVWRKKIDEHIMSIFRDMSATRHHGPSFIVDRAVIKHLKFMHTGCQNQGYLTVTPCCSS